MLRISDSLLLPVDLAGEAVAVLAKRGAGKTNTGVVLAEEMVEAGVQVVILDPVGAWWGIRSGADGGEGLAVPILGGQHGDVPLEQTAGHLIADVVVDTGQSMLIDLSDFPSKAAVNRFVTDFAERLYRRKARAKSLLHLILEEADEFAPQQGRADTARMRGAIEQIVRRGRSRGLGVTLITQRSAVLNKDVLTQADVLIVMRTTGPHDVKAIREWVAARGDEKGESVIASLPSLETGEAWVWNPERDLLDRVKIRRRRTFDSSQTPKAGEVRVEPTRSDIDLAALGEQIQETAERAKLNDPAELRKRIKELERQASTAAVVPTVETVEIRVEVPVLNGEVDDLRVAVSALESASAAIQESARLISGALDRWANVPPARPKPLTPLVRTAVAVKERPVSDDAVSRPQMKILDALAWFEAIGVAHPRRVPVAAVAGVSSKSSGFRANVSTLSGLGLIGYPGSARMALTDAGRELATPPDFAPTVEDLQDAICGMISGPQATLLRVLIAAYPGSLDREALADQAGVSALSSGYRANVSTLSGFELITYPSPGTVAAAPLLFMDE